MMYLYGYYDTFLFIQTAFRVEAILFSWGKKVFNCKTAFQAIFHYILKVYRLPAYFI